MQAGERTSHLFRLANHHGAIVVGTGDLSELALGWCTYGVGDHMSHYNVNASVPKTLIKYLIGWVAGSGQFERAVNRALERVLTTEISPELVPGTKRGQPTQLTESIIGPYALQDFHLYYTLRFGYAPAKIAFLAWQRLAGQGRLHAQRDPQVAGGVSHALLPDQPVQAQRAAQRPEGGLGRLAFAARRLARPVRRQRRGLAGRPRAGAARARARGARVPSFALVRGACATIDRGQTGTMRFD